MTEALTPYNRLKQELTKPETVAAMQAYLHGTALSQVKFQQVALAMLRNPAIVGCDARSIMLTIAGAAQLGLEFIAGQAYAVPFAGQCQLIVGYQGYVNLMVNAGYSTFADVVYEGDDYDYYVDETGQHLKHRKLAKDRTDDKLTHAYAMATTVVNGERLTTIMTLDRDELLKIRGASRASRKDAPWVKWFPEMCKKSAIRRLAKQCAKSTAVSRALEFEDRAERGEPIEDLVDVTPTDVEAIVADMAGGQ